jgi:peroxiredoxin Q/BCP
MITLDVNDQAPDFTAQDQDGKTHSLADYAGKKLVLYFYPKDDTPGCTAQACNLRDNLPHLQSQGYEVLGVSTDGIESHKHFADKFKLNFPLLADHEHVIGEAYGTYGEKRGMFGKMSIGTSRTTFIINEEGKIDRIIKRPDTKAQAEQVLGIKVPKAEKA